MDNFERRVARDLGVRHFHNDGARMDSHAAHRRDVPVDLAHRRAGDARRGPQAYGLMAGRGSYAYGSEGPASAVAEQPQPLSADKKKPVLVTGASGLVGTHTCRE